MNTQITEIIYKTNEISGLILEDSLQLDAFTAQNVCNSVMRKATFATVIFSECNFNCSEFQWVTFENCVFENCFFEFSHFRNCQFINCSFIGCVWKASTIQRSVFEDCTLDIHVTTQLTSNENLSLSKMENTFDKNILALVA